MGHSRILFKLSGEALAGQAGIGVDSGRVSEITSEIAELAKSDVQVALVVGGGNFFRGVSASDDGLTRVSVDYMGMLATIINAVVLRDHISACGVSANILSAINVPPITELSSPTTAIKLLESGHVVIFAAGTGSPYFSTDTAAALRAIEIDANVVLMAKNDVDGIYESDPKLDPKAIKFESLTYFEALQKRLGIMDSTALSLCMDNNLPLIVFDLFNPESLKKIALGDSIGSLVTSE